MLHVEVVGLEAEAVLILEDLLLMVDLVDSVLDLLLVVFREVLSKGYLYTFGVH